MSFFLDEDVREGVSVKNIKISVIIPSYNYAKYISLCVNSVIKQPACNYEVIIVDDGSTDDTKRIVNEIINDSPNIDIRYIYQANQGVSTARNTGVENSSGDYIWFLDSDDALLPNAFENALEFINKNPHLDMIYGGYRANYVNGPVVDRHPSRLSGNKLKDFSAILEGKIKGINTGCVICKKTVFDDFLFDTEVYTGQDFAFFAKVIATKPVQMVNKLLAEKTRHPDSLRDDYATKVKTGTKMVDAIFNDPMLGEEFKLLRSKFLARRLLTLSRIHHRNNEHSLTVSYYAEALRTNFRVVKRTRYLKCCLSSIIVLIKEKLGS